MAALLSLPSRARRPAAIPSSLTKKAPPFACPSPSSRVPICRKRRLSVLCLQKSQADLEVLGSFQGWLREKGVSFPSVKPGFVPEGLGLVAQKDIGRNEVVVEVPKRTWINLDTVAASVIGPVCSGSKPWIRIALFLLREMAVGEKSDWSPYIRILPKHMDSTIYWSEEELAELEGTQLLSTTLSVKEYVESEFNKVHKEILVPHHHVFPHPVTLDDFLWAFTILRSRAFSQHRGENLVLIPLADLINHSSSITTENSAWQIKGTGLFSRELIFSLRAPAPVKAGDQVYIQYDLKKSNAELALDYGFIETNSDRDVYTLTLEIPESDPFYEDKLDIAELNGLGTVAYFDVVLGRSLPELMLPYLRLLALGGSDAFLLEALFRDSIWDHLQLPVSRSNEEFMCEVVACACQTALSGYKTTIDEDEELKGRGDLPPRLKIAVGVRAAEKKVLQHVLKVFGERGMELDGLEYYQERRLKELGLVGEQGEIIFWESK
ncbi:fructose-bisphosphate aldolase-lysine N-methyltransferase, chloroplastic [Nymphaea colorata]|nr:fructose-bisphosphate aldolase-lysine N-methyltransferase, chloroplastic [Nymphaea colorata]